MEIESSNLEKQKTYFLRRRHCNRWAECERHQKERMTLLIVPNAEMLGLPSLDLSSIEIEW
jgi:hypothetical protein